jgi:NADH-quinone oxidoreductase subunit M
VQALTDLTGRELVIALSLSIMIFWIGIYPAPFLDMMNGSVAAIVERLERGAVVAEERGSTFDVRRSDVHDQPRTSNLEPRTGI